MCGIVGAIAESQVQDKLFAALSKLEYRGYDSSGIATIDDDSIELRKTKGKMSVLKHLLDAEPAKGNIGIAHTRWATHGEPNTINAHPHIANHQIAIVHNGIIENYLPLKEKLTETGVKFISQTDSEVVSHLINHHYQTNNNMTEALLQTIQQIDGFYAIAAIHKDNPKQLFVAKCGSPLVIGSTKTANYVASDIYALNNLTETFVYLPDNHIAILENNAYQIMDQSGKVIQIAPQIIPMDHSETGKGKYEHFMLKEIMEQDIAISNTLEHWFNSDEAKDLRAWPALQQITHIKIVACGTSYHAGCVARHWFENWARISCEVEIASEFRYRNPVIHANTLMIVISQSGETADTLAALKQAEQQNFNGRLALCNVDNSSMTQAANHKLLTKAGVEIGVASTKAFTTQLVALYQLALLLASQRDISLSRQQRAMQQLPTLIQQSLQHSDNIIRFAKIIASKDHAYFIGRGALFPIAQEGALKLKEISYIHAEPYPAGELKHGPLALIDKGTPVVCLLPNDEQLVKMLSNIKEIEARGGHTLILTDIENTDELGLDGDIIKIPPTPGSISPILMTLPLQLLAYHTAKLRGHDIDKPRNLAKSVTVE